jgi:hypothetical protein
VDTSLGVRLETGAGSIAGSIARGDTTDEYFCRKVFPIPAILKPVFRYSGLFNIAGITGIRTYKMGTFDQNYYFLENILSNIHLIAAPRLCPLFKDKQIVEGTDGCGLFVDNLIFLKIVLFRVFYRVLIGLHCFKLRIMNPDLSEL